MNIQQNVLVTGVNGFVGQHLARALHQAGHTVIGVGHGALADEVKEITASYLNCDLTDETAVKSIDFTTIDVVIHLAGLASPSMSFSQPRRFIADNSAMLINLFETANQQELTKKPRFLVVSSGAVYDSNQPMPITEDGKTTNASPYVISKLLNENLCAYYRTRGFECIDVRPFNHTGPGQGPGFILPGLTEQLTKTSETGAPMEVGNLKTRRDYSDVRDVAEAYVLLATQEKLAHNLYNICSGKSTSGEELLDIIVTATGVKKPEIVVDQSKIRPNDPPEIFGNSDRLKEDTGWQPKITLQQTVQDYAEWYKKNPF